MLDVFAEQRVAASLDGGGDDQGVTERQSVIAREGHGGGVRVQSDGKDVIERRAEQPKREFDVRPVDDEACGGRRNLARHPPGQPKACFARPKRGRGVKFVTVTVGQHFQTGDFPPVRTSPLNGGVAWRPGRPIWYSRSRSNSQERIADDLLLRVEPSFTRRMPDPGGGWPCSCLATPALAADEAESAPRGRAVTVLKAAKYCFNNNVEVSGIVLAREETSVRPEKLGSKVSEIMADAGDTVTAGQVLARITPPEGGSITVQAPVAGLISQSSAQIGGIVGGQGRGAVLDHRASEYRPRRPGAGEGYRQDSRSARAARIKIIGAGDVDARVRRIAPTIEPNSQLGQVFIGITPARRFLVNSSGRALIKTGQSCDIAVPLTSILYGRAGTVVQVIRRGRVETRRVETGLMAAGQVEIKDGLVGRRHRRRPRRRAAARRRSGAAGRRRRRRSSLGNCRAD